MRLAAFNGSSPKIPLYLADISYTDRVLSQILFHGNRCRSEKMQFAAFNGLSSKAPSLLAQKSRRYLLHKPSYSQFCPKFRWHGNGGQSGKNVIGSIRWPIPEIPPISLGAKIFYASRIIANFIPNFVAMATGVSRGKMQLAAFDGPSPKTLYRRKNLLRKPSYSPFCPKFRCHGNGGRSGKNAIGCIRWPIPENLPIGAKLSQKPFTQAEL